MVLKRKCRGFLRDPFVFVTDFYEECLLCLIDDETGLMDPYWVGAFDDADGSADEFIADDRLLFHSWTFHGALGV
ncbi:MAG: hypothetical protein H6P94_270 [Thermoplasmatales archaeon]|jgi:hypothetical protein|nr:hypothetical protein [Thermoplasmatales archaeon]